MSNKMKLNHIISAPVTNSSNVTYTLPDEGSLQLLITALDNFAWFRSDYDEKPIIVLYPSRFLIAEIIDSKKDFLTKKQRRKVNYLIKEGKFSPEAYHFVGELILKKKIAISKEMWETYGNEIRVYYRGKIITGFQDFLDNISIGVFRDG